MAPSAKIIAQERRFSKSERYVFFIYQLNIMAKTWKRSSLDGSGTLAVGVASASWS
jgi:hypothetical protein